MLLLAAGLILRLNKLSKWQVGIGGLAVFVLVNGFSWQVFAPYVSTLSSRTALRADNHYYHDREKKSLPHVQQFEVTRYEMDLRLGAGVNNQVKLTITSLEQLKSLVFSMYHDLKVEEVRMADQELSFTQEGDGFVVHMPQPTPANTPFELNIQYAGSTPLRFFATREAVMLPNFVAWYPVAGAHTVADFDNMTRYFPVYPVNQPEFVLHYQGPTPLYTNLKGQGNNTWKGVPSTGLVMMAGQVEQVQAGPQELIRPYALYNLSDNPQSEIASLLSVNNKISQIFGRPQREIKQLYVMETRLNNSLIWLGEDYLILDADSMSNFGSAFKLSDMNVEKLVGANVRTENWEGQDESFKQLFTHSFTYAFFKQQQPIGTETTSFSKRGESFRDEKQMEIYTQLLNFLNTESWQKIQTFYQAWQTEMNAPAKMEWTDLKPLLDSTKKE